MSSWIIAQFSKEASLRGRSDQWHPLPLPHQVRHPQHPLVLHPRPGLRRHRLPPPDSELQQARLHRRRQGVPVLLSLQASRGALAPAQVRSLVFRPAGLGHLRLRPPARAAPGLVALLHPDRWPVLLPDRKCHQIEGGPVRKDAARPSAERG